MTNTLKKQRSDVRRITLQQAVAEGLVAFELRGLGEGVTSRVKILITKRTDEPLEIVIPEGTEFVPVAQATGGGAS